MVSLCTACKRLECVLLEQMATIYETLPATVPQTLIYRLQWLQWKRGLACPEGMKKTGLLKGNPCGLYHRQEHKEKTT